MSAPLRKENQEILPPDNVDLTAREDVSDVVVEKSQSRPRLVPSSASEAVEPVAKTPGVSRSAAADVANTNAPDAKETASTADAGEPARLFPENEAQNLQQQWDRIQTRFVDQPRDAVRDADALVSSAIDRLSKIFGDERSRLEQQWSRGEDISTEDLRVALQRYRSFFRRMLSV
jgi:hypothetical protein